MTSLGKAIMISVLSLAILGVAVFVPLPWEWFSGEQYPQCIDRTMKEGRDVRYFVEDGITYRITTKMLFRFNGEENWSREYAGEGTWMLTAEGLRTTADRMTLHRQYDYICTHVDTTCMTECNSPVFYRRMGDTTRILIYEYKD